MITFADLFTPRQLVALGTLSDLVKEAREQAHKDAFAAELPEETSRSYADAVATYLAFAVDKLADLANSICPWEPVAECPRNLFGRQAILMQWNFAEGNPIGNSSGSLATLIDNLVRNMNATFSKTRAEVIATSHVQDAALFKPTDHLISTDPPYYDNVPYADLSDFFYVWMRRSLRKVYPEIFSTMLVPKTQELVADQKRHGGREQAQKFFEEKLGITFTRMRERANSDYPITVYYAFKQAESNASENGHGVMAVASTGWETMLEGLMEAGFQITGTWPMRTELTAALKAKLNALASSIVLVCRPRPIKAPPATRQEFVRALRQELPNALSVMMAENVAPVDLAQATIGPGMAIYSRYSTVVEADGSPMRVRTALQIINQSLDEHLAEAEGDVDPHTRFALTWFEQRGMESGPYGEAETIATARGVSVRGVQDAGILEARGGKARLLPRDSLVEDWDPATDGRLTDWEVVQYLIRALETEGEASASRLLARIGERGEGARDLSYRLYGICERKGWAGEALAYNGLVVSWPEITRLVAENPSGTESQTSMEF